MDSIFSVNETVDWVIRDINENKKLYLLVNQIKVIDDYVTLSIETYDETNTNVSPVLSDYDFFNFGDYACEIEMKIRKLLYAKFKELGFTDSALKWLPETQFNIGLWKIKNNSERVIVLKIGGCTQMGVDSAGQFITECDSYYRWVHSDIVLS